MKTLSFARWSLSLAAAAFPLLCGCVRETVNAAPAVVNNDESTAPVALSDAMAPAGDAPTQDLENAPAKIVSSPAQVAPAADLSATAAEVARLSQSGVDESVMLAYINSASSQFALGSDQIIYLNDIGVPGNVVTAMIQRDQVLKASGAPVVAAQQPQATEPPPTTAQDAPPSPESNVTSTYFQDSLAPYGNWIDVEGYGQCWQPSVVVADRNWTPYCDRGHWVYSDCGWYWSSDYSWGWAPFHYGRWFRHSYWGWCWAPDTVWGPSWVSWRYNSGYCGWAPLPPAAFFRPGIGFTYLGRPVRADFGFGLSMNHFTFVAANHFTDPRPFQHRISHQEVMQIFNNTVVINPVTEDRANPRFHRGIPAKQITEVTHAEIKQVKIQETTTIPVRGRGEEHDRNRGTLTVFHPALPTPPAQSVRIGEGIKPATPATVVPRIDPGAAMHRGIPRKTESFDTTKSASPERRNETVPIFRAPSGNNNPRETERTLSPAIRETPGMTPNVRTPAPSFNTPKEPTLPNNLLQREPSVTLPKPITPAPLQPVQPSFRDGAQRGQPRQEKMFIPPSYQAPRVTPAPPLTPELQPRSFSPAPVHPTTPAPQVTAPRIEAPRAVSPPPAQVPRDSGQRPSSGGGGNSPDKRQDNNPRNR